MSLNKFFSEFESLAFGIIDEAARNYPIKWVHSLITQNFGAWNGKTLLQVWKLERKLERTFDNCTLHDLCSHRFSCDIYLDHVLHNGCIHNIIYLP